jgi:alpha-D-xyloside xylohydrolase
VKFTDGYWLMRPGVRPSYPQPGGDVETGADRLTVHAPAVRERHRGDSLKGPVVTVTLSSPAPEVVRVRVQHYAGEAQTGPRFPVLAQNAPDVSVHVDDDEAVLTSGRLSARVDRGEAFRLSFHADGRELTGSGFKAMALLDTDSAVFGAGHFVREQLDLAVGEAVYGLGERFGPLVKNGQSVDVWNADGGTSSEQAYKNIPFYLTDGGYGVFVDHPGKVSFEVGSEVNSRVSFSVAGQTLEYLVVYGPTPKEVLRRYTGLTGRPALPPAWSFGLWLSTSFTTDYDEATVSSFVDGMAERDLPLSVFHFDCFWMRRHHWCDFVWDPDTFPDPEGTLARLKARGLKVSVWINPYIAQRSALFAEGAANGYLLRRADGSVWQWDLWQPGMALVDFTNPEARAWYAGKLRALLDTGVDTFKTDFGERVPTDVVWFDGSDPERMHNYYAQVYNETVFELLRKYHGDGKAVVFARSATAGGQQFPVHWGGDCESTAESMAESLRGGLSLGASGFGFWSHDIGGFEGTPEAELFKRWTAFGLLSSHSRLHGSGSYRVPWAFDEEAVDVLRVFTRLKARLMPYLYGAAVEASETGVPVMRAMALEFPSDPAVTYLDRQYMLGPDLLVAPVFARGGEVRYYVPEGVWTHVLSGERVSGPAWRTETHPVTSLPVLARPGSVVPFGAKEDAFEYDFADGVVLRVFSPEDVVDGVVTVPGASGEVAAVFSVRRDDGGVVVTAVQGSGSWSAALGLAEPVSGGSGPGSVRVSW